MKLIYAIIRAEDGRHVTEKLNQHHFIVTKLSSTGGFFHVGNLTLMIGTDDEKVSQVIDIIKEECSVRKEISIVNPSDSGSTQLLNYSMPIAVEVGGAIIFVVDVVQYLKV